MFLCISEYMLIFEPSANTKDFDNFLDFSYPDGVRGTPVVTIKEGGLYYLSVHVSRMLTLSEFLIYHGSWCTFVKYHFHRLIYL